MASEISGRQLCVGCKKEQVLTVKCNYHNPTKCMIERPSKGSPCRLYRLTLHTFKRRGIIAGELPSLPPQTPMENLMISLTASPCYFYSTTIGVCGNNSWLDDLHTHGTFALVDVVGIVHNWAVCKTKGRGEQQRHRGAVSRD